MTYHIYSENNLHAAGLFTDSVGTYQSIPGG
jgi:hypothetical protein